MWETYTIRYDEELNNGYWVISQEEEIRIKVSKEKHNHEQAAEAFKKLHPNANVTCVFYQ